MTLKEFNKELAEIVDMNPKDLHSDMGSAADVGWDSMAIVELVAMIEDKCDGGLSEEDVQELNSYEAILSFAICRGIIE